MMLQTNPKWRLAVECAELASGLVLLVNGAVSGARLFYKVHNVWLLALLATTSLLILALVSFMLKRQYQDFWRKMKKDRIEAMVTEEATKASSSHDATLHKVIPRSKYVKGTFKYIHDEALEWAPDAILGCENLYVDVSPTGISHTFQAIYHSNAKSLTRTFYINSRTGINFDNFVDMSEYARKLERGIALEYTRWRSAVVAALDSTCEQLPDVYKIAVQQSSDLLSTSSILSVSISYKLARVEKSITYRVLRDKLVNQTTKKEISY